jgi:hypothetical protein
MCKSIFYKAKIRFVCDTIYCMKHKIFLGILVLIFTIGTVALADYIDPSFTPSGGNTPKPVLTNGTNQRTYETIGTWEAKTNPLNSTSISNYSTAASLLASSTYAGNEDTNNKKGLFSEKLVVLGVTKIISGDLVSMVENTSGSSFDQFISAPTYVYPVNSSTKTAKSLEGIVTGRLLSKLAISDKADIIQSSPNNPAYTLDMLATTTTNFAPTTNIGLGDKCNLYPVDLGTVVGDGGCLPGSYLSYYKAPSFSGTISSSNNTNTQVVGVCTSFSPSASPTNTGHCPTGQSMVTMDWGTGYRCNDSTSSDYNKVDYRNVYSFCDDGSSPGKVVQNGLCEIWAYPKSSGTKSPQIRRIDTGANPTTSSYVALSTNGYSYIFNCTDTATLQVTDSYGQYAEFSN